MIKYEISAGEAKEILVCDNIEEFGLAYLMVNKDKICEDLSARYKTEIVINGDVSISGEVRI